MPVKFLDDDAPKSARLRFLDEDKPSSAAEEVGRITEEQVAREQAALTPAQREEIRTRERVTYSPGVAALQALSAIPAMAGVAKGAQLVTRGGKLAPYGQRAAEPTPEPA